MASVEGESPGAESYESDESKPEFTELPDPPVDGFESSCQKTYAAAMTRRTDNAAIAWATRFVFESESRTMTFPEA